jgi:hypothetical protein
MLNFRIAVSNEAQVREVVEIISQLGGNWREVNGSPSAIRLLAIKWLYYRDNKLTYSTGEKPTVSGAELPIWDIALLRAHLDTHSSEGGLTTMNRLYQITVLSTKENKDGEDEVQEVLVPPYWRICRSERAARDHGLIEASTVVGFDSDHVHVRTKTF